MINFLKNLFSKETADVALLKSKVYLSSKNNYKHVVEAVDEEKGLIAVVHGTIQKDPRWLTLDEFKQEMVAIDSNDDIKKWKDSLLSERKKIYAK